VFKWTSDVLGCAANLVSEVTSTGTAVSGQQSYTITNPTSGATGTFDPYLNVSLSTAVDKMIYLKGTSSSKYDLAGGVSSTFKVLLRVCGNEQIAVLSDEPFVLSESVTATVQTIPMTDFFSVSTEIDCSETEYSLTTDQAGTLLLTNSATATLNSGILSIDKSSPASMSFFIFAKTKGWKTAV